MNTIKHRKKANGGGRPRTFDENVALEQAMRVFWRKGYEGTSLADLTTEMGINPPSLYRTFGNKEKLFWKAIDRYGEGPAAYVAECLNEPTAFAVVAKRLGCAVDVMSDPAHPWGCLATQAAVTCGDQGRLVQKDSLRFAQAHRRHFVSASSALEPRAIFPRIPIRPP